MKNSEHVIDLFQSMFEKNMLTFNPGWNQAAQPTDDFTDVRALRDELAQRGIAILSDEIQQDAGPASVMIEDPDGNAILIDQHR